MGVGSYHQFVFCLCDDKTGSGSLGLGRLSKITGGPVHSVDGNNGRHHFIYNCGNIRCGNRGRSCGIGACFLAGCAAGLCASACLGLGLALFGSRLDLSGSAADQVVCRGIHTESNGPGYQTEYRRSRDDLRYRFAK